MSDWNDTDPDINRAEQHDGDKRGGCLPLLVVMLLCVVAIVGVL